MTLQRAVVFLGPSMTHDQARTLLEADYRAPARRGDLDELAPGTVVGLIDGVFEQELALTPREVSDAVARGVVIFGGSSMGALRAAEVTGVHGVGRVFEWYRDGIVTRDDEVALLFDPWAMLPMTVPTVNVRFAAERLRSLGTIDGVTASALVAGAETLHFKERTYPRILEAAGLANRKDCGVLIAMLEAHDVKANDAQAVLEAVDRHLQVESATACVAPSGRAEPNPPVVSREADNNSVLIWESGDRATDMQLWRFLGMTGRLCEMAEAVTLRQGGEPPDMATEALQEATQNRFACAAARWGWLSSDEAAVSMVDLRLDKDVVSAACADDALANGSAMAALSARQPAFRAALRARLFLDDMALKREVMRLASLDYFSARAPRAPSSDDLREARNVLCRLHRTPSFNTVKQKLEAAGVESGRAVAQLAAARLAGRALRDGMMGRGVSGTRPDRTSIGFGLRPCLKPAGEARFSLGIDTAESMARGIAEIIGVTRIGLIGELGDLGKVQVAQAARPDNAWSSSYGSGKSLSKAGAIVGSVMEECEKWAQERFRPAEAILSGSYQVLKASARAVDPATLDLPYDSSYAPDAPLDWYPVNDLMTGERMHLPADVLDMRRRKHDICYSARGARKHMATNGLGAAFTLEEAILHGLCEYVERHAQRIAELYLSNPGGLGLLPYHFVDPASSTQAAGAIAHDLAARFDCVRVLDITSEIRIPTFAAALVRDGRIANGYGTHPNPEVAIEMALLEAAQTLASAVAGGREDLSVHARSLGRHERPRPFHAEGAWFWIDSDARETPVAELGGVCRSDVLDELVWCLERLHFAGIQHVLVCDLSRSEIAPVRVVRIIIPGLETNNPFFTGPRARLALLRDLLPRWA